MSENKIPRSDINYFRRKVLVWGRSNYADFPWRSTSNRWHALVAEIMLQRTKAEQVLPVYISFADKYRIPEDFINDKSARPFEPLGLHWRDREFRSLTTVLANGNVPEAREVLLKLPGVGPYISAAFRSLHAGVRDVIIDSNVVRLYGRYFGFLTDGETRRKKWFMHLAERITPLKSFKDFNYGLLDFTRMVCRPRPRCLECILRQQCNYVQ